MSSRWSRTASRSARRSRAPRPRHPRASGRIPPAARSRPSTFPVRSVGKCFPRQPLSPRDRRPAPAPTRQTPRSATTRSARIRTRTCAARRRPRRRSHRNHGARDTRSDFAFFDDRRIDDVSGMRPRRNDHGHEHDSCGDHVGGGSGCIPRGGTIDHLHRDAEHQHNRHEERELHAARAFRVADQCVQHLAEDAVLGSQAEVSHTGSASGGSLPACTRKPAACAAMPAASSGSSQLVTEKR